jgi:ornithine decarboxylase
MDLKTLIALAEEYREDSPIIIVDHQVIRDNYTKFKKVFPRIEPYYSVKANPLPEIIRTMYKEGAGFDIASIEEYDLVDENVLGTLEVLDRFMENKIIYANTIKQTKSLKKIEMKNLQMTFDNFLELDKIKACCRNPRLVLRIRVPNKGSVVELSSKFGASPDEAIDLLKYAKNLGLNVEGISFHVGSQCENYDNYTIAIKTCRKLFDEAKNLGFALNLLDIGGGYPVPYYDDKFSLEDLGVVINKALDMYFPSDDVKIIAEPGRYLVATAATSVSEIIGKATRDGLPYYYINDGVYNTFSGVIFDHINYHFKSFKSGPKEKSTVAGPTCDALDTIIRGNELPDLNLGDLLIAENVGAYTNASATKFNGFQPARIIHINEIF